MMPALTVPASCATALKEWATVLEAMAHGEQLVLIRKGGLIEPGSGFGLLSPTFIFYPTFEHQAVNYVRPPYPCYFEEAMRRRAPEGQVRVELCGLAVASKQVHDPAVIERLSAFHIYHEAFVSQRLKWQPEQPLVVAVVRAYRLASAQVLPVIERYAGCKSWVELAQPVSLAGASPVLDDAAFAQRLAQIQALW
jgi:hypothetical protein